MVQQALHGLSHQRVQLLIDRVRLRDQPNILGVRVGFRRRAIPRVWRALAHRGSRSLTNQQALIQTAVQLVPAGVRISVHGDSEFRSHELFGWLRGQGEDAMLGIRGQMWVYDTADARADGQPLAARVAVLPAQTATGRKRKHRTSPITSLAQVFGGQEQRTGPVNLLGWWERDDDGKVVLHAVMPNLPATARTKA